MGSSPRCGIVSLSFVLLFSCTFNVLGFVLHDRRTQNTYRRKEEPLRLFISLSINLISIWRHTSWLVNYAINRPCAYVKIRTVTWYGCTADLTFISQSNYTYTYNIILCTYIQCNCNQRNHWFCKNQYRKTGDQSIMQRDAYRTDNRIEVLYSSPIDHCSDP